MWTNENIAPQIQLMRQRVQNLYQRGGSLSQQNELLAAAFEELEIALEHLQKLETQQRLNHEEWLNDRAELEIESLRYQHLFINAPAGYLVTSLDGTIRNANPTAAKLLECTERQLIGRSIALFTPEGQRREFRAQIAQLAQASAAQEWVLDMQSWERNAFKAGMTVVAVRGKSGERPIALHWLVRAMAEQKQAEPVLHERQVGGTQRERMASLPLEQNDLELSALARQRFLFLAQISVQLMSAQDIDTMLGQVAQLLVPNIADACVLDLFHPMNTNVRRLVAAREHGAKPVTQIWRRSFNTTRYSNPVVVSRPPTATIAPDGSDATARQELEAILRPLEPASAIVAPILAGERQVGSVTLILAKAMRQYNALDVALVEELARQIGDAASRLR